MLKFVILFLDFIKSQQKKHTLDTTLSLFGPPLDENGRSPRYNFYGDYSCTTHCSTGYSYTQLGYLGNSSKSILSSKLETTKNFRADFKLQIDPLKKQGEKLLIYFSQSQIQTITDSLNGAIVLIKLNSTDFSIQANSDTNIDFNKLKKSSLPVNLFNSEFDLRIEKVEGKFKVFVKEKEKENFEKIFEFPCELKKGYLSIGVDQGNGFSKFKLFGIRFYVTTDMEVYEVKKSNFLVWFLFVLFAAALSWYLYKNYMKYK